MKKEMNSTLITHYTQQYNTHKTKKM